MLNILFSKTEFFCFQSEKLNIHKFPLFPQTFVMYDNTTSVKPSSLSLSMIQEHTDASNDSAI